MDEENHNDKYVISVCSQILHPIQFQIFTFLRKEYTKLPVYSVNRSVYRQEDLVEHSGYQKQIQPNCRLILCLSLFEWVSLQKDEHLLHSFQILAM